MILSLEKELEGSFDSDFISIAILFVCSLSLTNPHSWHWNAFASSI